jgi:hypothetical protein
LREDLVKGARGATLDGRKLQRGFWKNHRIGVDPIRYYGFAERESDGSEVAGRLLISDPIPEPRQVKVVNWPTKLWRGLLGLEVETETAAASGKAWGDLDYETCDDWLDVATKEERRKPREGDSAYARRLARLREKQVRRNRAGETWEWTTIRTRLIERRKSDQS